MFIGTMASGGGGEKVLSMIANHMIEKGWDVDIVLLLGTEVNREHFNLNEKIKIMYFSFSQSYIKNSIAWLYNIRKYVNKTKPDVIISFFGRINAVVLTATIGKEIPIIISERSNPHSDGRGNFMLRYCNWIYRRASKLVFQTKFQQNCFSPVHFKRSIIIPNPIKIVDVPNCAIDKNLIITAGRLHPFKNQQMLIDAMELVVKQCPNANCILYGDGQLHDVLQQSINEKHLQNNVELAGKKIDILKYVAKAYIFVMTSNLEGLSNALIEAMMMEKICITTDYEGADEIIKDGKNGIIVPRKDARKLAEALIHILSADSEKYKAMSKEARKTVSGFNETTIMNQWDELISSCIN